MCERLLGPTRAMLRMNRASDDHLLAAHKLLLDRAATTQSEGAQDVSSSTAAAGPVPPLLCI